MIDELPLEVLCHFKKDYGAAGAPQILVAGKHIMSSQIKLSYKAHRLLHAEYL